MTCAHQWQGQLHIDIRGRQSRYKPQTPYRLALDMHYIFFVQKMDICVFMRFIFFSATHLASKHNTLKAGNAMPQSDKKECKADGGTGNAMPHIHTFWAYLWITPKTRFRAVKSMHRKPKNTTLMKARLLKACAVNRTRNEKDALQLAKPCRKRTICAVRKKDMQAAISMLKDN